MDHRHWNPLSEFDHLFGRRQLPVSMEPAQRFSWKPAADISETKEEYVIKADLPDVSRKDMTLSIENGVITITGERREEACEDDKTTHHTEKFYGRFSRSFSLPENVDVNQINAQQDNGVLSVHLPKTKAEKSKSQKIEIT